MEHNFILRYRLDPADAASDVDDILERLGEAGCMDALVEIGAPGQIVLDFARSSTSLQQAIRIAVADVERAIPTAVLYSTEVPENGEKVDELLMARLVIMERLMTELTAWIEANQLTYAGAAAIFGVKPARVYEITRMNPQNLTIDALVDKLLRAGKSVRFEICQPSSS
ncbi:XRE family transcriptional regulator [Herbaspirillum sp. alder98]|uniref:XRE family transcriptional regulator n=1 Tax=Herbaspirillum sp. alder98 TaxID=2913096 RepID=UPI001CD83023|nr:XRE family transcriptional regulator [Herbaspirillum sp. alder98]MCA1326395.1 XRE family transcriptional regulator [Herbaspirillum sp. alder98]